MDDFLFGLHFDYFQGIPGIYVTDHHIKGWRYFSSYNNGKSKKKLIFQKLAAGGMKERADDWDWHHVVEGAQLIPLFSTADFDKKYEYEWPTVLMHSREEHKILNSLFRSKGTSEGLQKAGLEPLTGDERNTYLATLLQRYHDIYTGDPVLQKIARNVITGIIG